MKLTPRQYLFTQFGTNKDITLPNFTLYEVAELLNEFYEINELLAKKHSGVEIDVKAWIAYNECYQEWLHSDYRDSFEAGMSEPNAPGYYRANND